MLSCGPGCTGITPGPGPSVLASLGEHRPTPVCGRRQRGRRCPQARPETHSRPIPGVLLGPASCPGKPRGLSPSSRSPSPRNPRHPQRPHLCPPHHDMSRSTRCARHRPPHDHPTQTCSQRSVLSGAGHSEARCAPGPRTGQSQRTVILARAHPHAQRRAQHM